MLKLMKKQQLDQTEVMFDIVAFKRSFRLPFKRNAKITASAAAADACDSTAANDAGGIGAGSDHLTVSFR